jgi:hypothetical protein
MGLSLAAADTKTMFTIDLPLSAYLRKALEKAQEKRAEQARKRREKRDAKREEQKSLQQKKREEAGEPEPKCSSCGQEGHLRSSSKACPNYKRKLAAQFAAEGLTRKATIKTSLQNGCNNEILRKEIQQAVLKSRNLAHVGSLFTNFAVVNRIHSGGSLPPLDHTFFYNMFCQLIGQGSHADQWVKDSYIDFRQLMPAALSSSFYADAKMITRIAKDYQKNVSNHIASNFERNSTNYFFLGLNNDTDTWYVADATVQERKSIAAYMYKRAASLECTWPEVENEHILESTFDERARSISLGPTPVTEASLYSQPHLYLPFMYQVMVYMDNQVHILEPVPQNFASKAYVHPQLKEVSQLTVDQLLTGY